MGQPGRGLKRKRVKVTWVSQTGRKKRSRNDIRKEEKHTHPCGIWYGGASGTDMGGVGSPERRRGSLVRGHWPPWWELRHSGVFRLLRIKLRGVMRMARLRTWQSVDVARPAGQDFCRWLLVVARASMAQPFFVPEARDDGPWSNAGASTVSSLDEWLPKCVI